MLYHTIVKNSKDRVIDLIRFVIFFQLAIVGATIFGCFMPGKVCDSDVKQHIANMMTVITTSTFALYAEWEIPREEYENYGHTKGS